MAVQYAPLFALETQFQAKNGRNLTGGFLRVFLAATDDPADTYSDYNGTRNPDNIVLDDDGRAVVICDKSKAYRLEVYDADGMLMWTEEPVFCSGSGGAGMSSSTDIISTDGTIVVEKSTSGSSTTFDIGLGVDMDRLDPSCLSADATARNSDGKFVFGELSKEGDLLSVDNYGCVRCEPAWYHFTAIVELSYDQVATNTSQQITLYTTLSNSVVDFDLSYAHRESIELSGDIHVVESNSEFVLGVTGLPNGVVASLVDFDIHAITGHEQSTEYTAGNGISIADHVISADLDVVQQKLTAGANITITDNVISAENLSQEQADWTQEDSEQPSFIKHKPDLSVYATTSAMETALAGKQDVISDLSTIRSGAAAGATALQPSALDDYSTTQEMNTALAAKQDVISDLSAIRAGAQAGATALQPSALDDYSTTQEMNTALAAKQDVISDLSTIRSGAALGATAVQPADMNTALAGKQDVISDLATIRSGAALGASSVQPNDLATVATTGDYDDLVDKPDLSIYAESADLATVATTGDYADLSNRPSIPTKTSDLTNDSGFITDADVPVKDVQVDGASVVNAQGTAEIDLSGYATTSAMNTALAGKQDTISDLSTIRSGAALGASSVQPGDLATVATTGSYDDLSDKPTIPAAQVNSDWNAVSGVSQILNRPNLAAVATTGDYDDLSNKPSIPAAQVNADWSSNSGVSAILNKPQNLVQDANYVHTDENFTSAEKTKLAGIEAGAQVNVKPDWNAVAGADDEILNKPSLATVATTGAYSDLSGTPTIPTVDQSYNASSPNAQSGVAVAQAIASIPSSSYTAGDGIDITNNEISVDYDTNTLDTVGQTVTENVTQKSSSGLFLLPSSVAALLSQQDNTQVTVHIPANTLKDETFYIEDVSEVTFRITLYATDSSSESSVSLFSTPIEYTLDVDQAVFTEQDIVFNLPASVANQWSQNLSSAVAFNICGQKYSAPATDSSLTVVGDLSTSPITFTFVDASVTKLAVKNPLPASAPGDAAKVLTVDSNGDPVWAAAQAPISAGTGISITNNVVSVDNTVAMKSDLPTATSDLTNDSGFITLSDVPAQVNADWNSSSGASEILNKPTIPSGTQLVPAATSADADKVLTVNAQGTPEWATGGGSQVHSDWTEADSSAPSYIENKPVPKTLTAGTGISISENASTITIANTTTPPTVDQAYNASSANAQSGTAVASAIAAIGTWTDVTSEITASQTIITSGSMTFRYNAALRLISLMGEIHVQGAGDVYTLPEKYRPQTNFTLSNPGATSYIDYTPSTGKFVARSGANGYFSWTMTMPCLGE